SSRMRNSYTLRAIASAVAGVSVWVTPSRTSRPSSMAPTTSPSTVTLARLTVCTTARIGYALRSVLQCRYRYEEAALDEVRDDRPGDRHEILLGHAVRGREQRELVAQRQLPVAARHERKRHRVDLLLLPAQPVGKREHLPAHLPSVGP